MAEPKKWKPFLCTQDYNNNLRDPSIKSTKDTKAWIIHSSKIIPQSLSYDLYAVSNYMIDISENMTRYHKLFNVLGARRNKEYNFLQSHLTGHVRKLMENIHFTWGFEKFE